MRVRSAASVALLLVACAQASAYPKTSPAVAPSPVRTALAADPNALASFYGSYRTDDGEVFVIARLGWFFDVRNATYRTIYVGTASNRFSIGPAFAVPMPKFADLIFDAGTLTVSTTGSTVLAHRVENRETRVSIPATGAPLSGAITEPLGAGRHPGIVIVHGSEPGERHFYDIWVGIYTGLGMTVLTYDKRGIGSSTGRYPGEFATDAVLQVFADD